MKAWANLAAISEFCSNVDFVDSDKVVHVYSHITQPLFNNKMPSCFAPGDVAQ